MLCTDGLSNVGVGSLEDQEDDVLQFYQNLAEYAKSKSVVVNIISIEGEECELEALRPLFAETGGSVNIIQPEELKDNFANILKSETIATNTLVKIKLHKALEFRNEDPRNLNKDQTMLIKNVGSVNEDSEITFEYRVKPEKELTKLPDFDIKQLKQIPIQTIIEYTKLDGRKMIRTITKMQKTTEDLSKAQKNVQVEILAANAIQKASTMAQLGDYRGAQAYSLSSKLFMKRAAKNLKQKADMKTFKSAMTNMYNLCHQVDDDIAQDHHKRIYTQKEKTYKLTNDHLNRIRTSSFVPDRMSKQMHEMNVAPRTMMRLSNQNDN